MPGPRTENRPRATPAPLPDDQGASGRTDAPDARGRGASKPEGTGSGARRRRAKGGASAEPDTALHGLLRGLRAGDLESVLLTVAMAAEENRMPSADPDEVRRILAFLARLAEHDAGLPPPPNGPGGGRKATWDGIGAEGEDGAPAR